MNSLAKVALIGFIILTLIGILIAIWRELTEEEIAPSFSQLTITAEVSGNTILVNGTTDLPDNALLRIKLSKNEHGLPIAQDKPSVSGGKYQASLTSSLEPGTYVVSAFLTAKDQDEEVLKRIGEYGENLKGENTYRGQDSFAAYTFMKAITDLTKSP